MMSTPTVKKRVPKLRFPEFDGEWEEKRLGELTTKVGSGITPKGGSDVYVKNAIPLIRSQNVLDNKLELDGICIDLNTHEKMKNSWVYPNDILLNITGASLGRSCVVPSTIDIANVNQHVCIIRPKKVLESKFLQSVLSSTKGQIQLTKLQSGSGREGLNYQNIREFRIKITSFKEQQKIAAFLSAVDKKIEMLSKKKELLEQYKKGVMQQIFTQKIRFNDPNGNPFPAWQTKRLGDLGIFLSGGTPSTSNEHYWKGDIPWISSSDLDEKSIHKVNISKYINKKAIDSSATKIIPMNSVLIVSRVGVGKIAVSKKAICTSQDFLNLVLDNEIVNSNFVAYYLKHQIHELLKINQGTSIKGFVKEDLSSFKMKVPIQSEQELISSFIIDLDNRFDLIDEISFKVIQFKKSLLQQMLV